MAAVAGGFELEEFLETLNELKQPLGTDWRLLVESADLSIYQRLEEQTGLYEYKAFGVLKKCPPDLLADVYMDLAYRKQWDQYVKQLYEEECNGKTVVYWEVNYPFPMWNRDYVYTQQQRELNVEGQKVHVILAKSISVPKFPERSDVVRVKQYKQKLVIESDGKAGSDVFLYYFDNPGGSIPSWLINWVAQNGLPNYLKNLAEACENYHKRT